MEIKLTGDKFANAQAIPKHDRVLLQVGQNNPRHSKMISLTPEEALRIADALIAQVAGLLKDEG